MPVYTLDEQVLVDSDQVAISEDCCCFSFICGPPCNTFPITATITISCEGGGGTCTCSGSLDYFTSSPCQYRGGCNTPDCSDMPVQIDIKNVGGVWQIYIFFDTVFTGICPTHNDQFCTGWDGLACNYIDLTTNSSPDGTYSIIVNDAGSTGSATVDLVIEPCAP